MLYCAIVTVPSGPPQNVTLEAVSTTVSDWPLNYTLYVRSCYGYLFWQSNRLYYRPPYYCLMQYTHWLETAICTAGRPAVTVLGIKVIETSYGTKAVVWYGAKCWSKSYVCLPVRLFRWLSWAGNHLRRVLVMDRSPAIRYVTNREASEEQATRSPQTEADDHSNLIVSELPFLRYATLHYVTVHLIILQFV